jgi:hypothetical protein
MLCCFAQATWAVLFAASCAIFLRMSPQTPEPKDWWVPKDWGEEQGLRIAQAIRRLRGSRSAQWVANRTTELGHTVSRSVIADLENGRRRYVTTAELIVLAAALNTVPLALLFPSAEEMLEILPGNEMTGAAAVGWFTGTTSATPAGVTRDPSARSTNASICSGTVCFRPSRGRVS